MYNSYYATICAIGLVGVVAIIVSCTDANSSTVAAWVQAIGSIVAIIVAFMIANNHLGDHFEKDAEDRRDTAHAARQVAYQAIELVAERLEAAMYPQHKAVRYRLRGPRTTEMVAAMREFDTQRLPPRLLSDFILLRSLIYAVNVRISEVYKKERRDKLPRPHDRTSELVSAKRVYQEACSTFQRLSGLVISDFTGDVLTLTVRPRLD